jgi:hypothetical protein
MLALRGGALVACVALALVGYTRVLALGLAGHADALLLQPLLVLTITYAAACWLVVSSAPQQGTRARWLELGLILLAGMVFRALFLATPPGLSHDAYRYAWDPYLLAHGISPYLHAPDDPSLAHLRDTAIFPHLNWITAPTIYPPGAQAFFLLVSLIAPLNILAVKLAVEVCDALAALLSIVLLRRRGLDLRRVLVYWWSPIPVVEFAFNAHVDAVAIVWTLAVLVVVEQRWRGARAAGGALLGLAALTKLFPALFALAIVRKRDRAFIATLVVACILAYLLFLPSGLGSGGFLGSYFTQRFVDQGILLQALSGINGLTGGSTRALLLTQGLALGMLCAAVVWWRWRRRGALRPEVGLLALNASWITVAPHLLPWYVAILLPLVALDLRLPGRGAAAAPDGERGGHVVTALAQALWLFTLAMPFTYVIFASGGNPRLFLLFFLVPAAAAALPPVLGRLRARKSIPAPT